MKKKFGIIGIALVLAMVASLCFGGVALAGEGDGLDADIDWSDDSGASGDVGVTWNGSGYVGGSVTVGPGWDGAETSFAQSSFYTSGNGLAGNYSISTSGQMGGYDGPNTYSAITASVTNGWVEFVNVRTGVTDYRIGQHSPLPGQVSYNYVGTGYYVPDPADPTKAVWDPGTGSGQLSMSSRNHYAKLSTYGGAFNANGQYTIISQFASNHDQYGPTDNWAGLTATGEGTADIDMGHSVGAGQITFGWGGGCFTNADATFTGSGTFGVDAVGSTQIRTPIADYHGNLAPGGWTISGSGTYGTCSYSVIANFAGPFSVGNYSVDVR